MNILLNSDGYHFTMGYMIGDDAMQTETHVLYARSGGPMVVPNINQVVQDYVKWRPTQQDIEEADEFWTSQGVPFNRVAWEKIAAMKNLPISIRGVREGEVVMPGEPVAIIEAPAVLAAVPEPVFISSLMKSMQVATRFTKVSSALSWDRSRFFEVGMRAANSIEDHIDSIKTLASVGLLMTSSGVAAKEAGISAGGSMGHRFTQRFQSDYEAFNQAVYRMIEFRKEKQIQSKVKVSFLLDTRNTLESGLKAAVNVIKDRFVDIQKHLLVSVRLDSGDLDYQLRVIIKTFKKELAHLNYLPKIIMESGLTPEDIQRFEAIAGELGFPLEKMFYGVGGYLVGGINRDFISMVYKVSSYGDTPTMKFADEVDGGKQSYPGEITLVERMSDTGIERMLVNIDELEALQRAGWQDVFIDLVEDGKVVAQPVSQKDRISRIETRWESLAQNYIGNEKRPDQFSSKPMMSKELTRQIEILKQKHFSSRTKVANGYKEDRKAKVSTSIC